jgi:hypothetical protein
MFCGIKKLTSCLRSELNTNNGIVLATMLDEIEVRRFGMIQDGTPIVNDGFGEPVNMEAQQNYKSWIIKVDIDAENQENQESSAIGGRSGTNENIVFYCVITEDLQENDLVIYPIGSNNSFRIRKDSIIPKQFKRKITAYSEVKSVK